MTKVITKINEMQYLSDRLRAEGKHIGFVPTMGFLHEGHVSLVNHIKPHCDVIVMSIFVNPTQFGPGEDFEKYPRDPERDKKMAQDAGVDIIFFPSAEEMYEKSHLTAIRVKKMTETMCGISRPGHFEGVTTVVLKLFNIVKPHTAVFGQKDYQQSLVIRKMVSDLNVDVNILTAPIIRENDGIAMSSRNKYLSAEERHDALALSESLRLAENMIKKGEHSSEKIIQSMKNLIEQKKSVRIDYIKIADPGTLEDVEIIKGKTLVAVAAYAGETRLIDNVIVENK